MDNLSTQYGRLRYRHQFAALRILAAVAAGILGAAPAWAASCGTNQACTTKEIGLGAVTLGARAGAAATKDIGLGALNPGASASVAATKEIGYAVLVPRGDECGRVRARVRCR
jgi:hypothetical protein